MKSDARSYASLLSEIGFDSLGRSELRRLATHALVPLAVTAVLAGTWSATAPLSGAVIAPARLKMELNRKTVQHRREEIVREILVRDGQKVAAGDPLVVIGDVRATTRRPARSA